MAPKRAGKKQVVEKTIEEQYQKLSLHEHVLKRPDSYIGTVEPDEGEYWVVNGPVGDEKMERKRLKFVPGLFKIFDMNITNFWFLFNFRRFRYFFIENLTQND